MTFKWKSDDRYLKLVSEVDLLVTNLAQTNHFNKILEELKELKSGFGSDTENYIFHLLRLDNYLWTLYGSYIGLFQKNIHSSKIEFENWYSEEIVKINEKEKNGRWQAYAENALLLLQREFAWDKDKIIDALESRYVRDKAILELSETLYLNLINTSFQDELLMFIKEDILAGAMFGSALNIGADKYLEIKEYRQTKINNYGYFDFCGY
ncbi:hypothetical protein [Priestia flexa]|uniref:hypothetical protein n=1 Tax=Priestia flexa TaxID=86664 RepID=UPI001C98DF49|nr:hypothetical protein [Priestia flexa]MBY6088675.1 hypothetical protein [Priestia flexa]